jgi:NADPH-dependent 2,4-dienoyl-CoA reductase/sulfur reductase-like enzyme
MAIATRRIRVILPEHNMNKTEFAVVGGGPAGLSAAIEAAKAGVNVTLIDENEKPGGQLFKQIHKFFGSKDHHAGTRGIDIGYQLLEEVEKSGANVMLNSLVWGIFKEHTLGVIHENRNTLLEADRILLSTGAIENSLAFPNWTISGVMGAGAIQTLVNVHRVLPGKRVLMIGSGNVGLIVSYQLLQAGAQVVGIVEAAPKIGGYAVHASKVSRRGVPIYVSTTIKEAIGKEKVEKAVLVSLDKSWKQIPGSEKTVDVDVICLACGLSPLSELAWMAGVKFAYIPQLGGHIPVHNEDMETSIKGLYVAGDVAGVEEASSAIEEGRLAGVAAAESLGKLSHQEAKIKKDAIIKRLGELRSGPFGEVRFKAIEQLVNGGRE